MAEQESAKVDSKRPDGSHSLPDPGAGEKASERRNNGRHRVLKGARIALNGRSAAIDCTVRNLSDRGACLNVDSPVGIPDSFDLVLAHASVRNCRVAWRKATQIGVEFV
jgi:PilZ domain